VSEFTTLVHLATIGRRRQPTTASPDRDTTHPAKEPPPKMIGIDVLEWPGLNQAFIVSFVAAIVLSLAVIPYGKRRPVGAPFSWGEAMLGGVYSFGVLFLAFGIVPHQWIFRCRCTPISSNCRRKVAWSAIAPSIKA
jgi:hypothetical protein